MATKNEDTVQRHLSHEFMEKLKTGDWKGIIKKVKSDPTLHFQIRKDYINIYYRGHNALKLDKNGKIDIHEKFCDEKIEIKTVDDWLDELSEIKNKIDSKSPSYERESQQLIARENSFSKVSNDTDYFVIDTEFPEDNKKPLYDMLAIKWPSTSQSRKTPKNIQLSIIEMKYGQSAMGYLESHYNNILNIKNMSLLKETAISQFKQLRELNLITFSVKGNMNVVDKLEEEVEFILLLANYKPSSNSLTSKNKLENIGNKLGEFKKKKIDIKFATSNFMGYGLYANAMIGFDEFNALYEKRKDKSK